MSSNPKRHAQPTDETDAGVPLFEEENRKGIAALKNGKAAGIDDVLVKQLNNLTLHK